MPLSDPDLLDIVRKLRQHMSSFDNTQAIMTALSKIDDRQVVDATFVLIPKISNVAKDINNALKIIEGSRQYREMIRRYGLDGENND